MKPNVKLKKNVYKNYIYTLLQSTDLTRGIWMIYLAGKGMSLTQLGLLETIFHITSFTMEVPTGAVADIFSRRASRIWGRILSLVSVVLLFWADSFLWFAISFVFSALSYNLESGAGDALVYDSLKQIGEEDQFMRVSGNKELFYQVAGIISFVVGGYLATKSYGIAFTLTIIIGIMALVQATRFVEPKLETQRKRDKKENVFIKQLKDSIAVIKKNPRIGFLIIFCELILAFCTCIFFYLQNYLKADGYSEAMIGLMYGGGSLAVALVAPHVYKIERRIKERGILFIIPIITIASIWGIVLSKYYYVFYTMMMITEEIIYISIIDYINKMIPSENRATILSFASMIFSFFMITLFPVVGIIGDNYSLSIAIISLASLGSVLVMINCYLIISKENRRDKEKVSAKTKKMSY